MSVINAVAQLLGFGTDGYQISRSVRLRSSASAYLNRTPAGAGNQHTWTFSAWVKRGTFGPQVIYNTAATIGSNTNLAQIYFDGNNKLVFFQYSGTTTYTQITTTQVFRDPSAWYHIVVAYDDTQATAANRVKIYVNGLQVTAFDSATYPTQNFNGFFNIAQPHAIGRDIEASPIAYFDGYLTEINFIDGQALTPSSFGSTNAVTGVWQPIKYTGTYGTNGFYLNFNDNSAATAAAIGKDYSGNGNNWTPNNISVTAGVTYDSMLDVPTLYADGGNGRGNYAVLNPLAGGLTPTNGNLTCNQGSAAWASTASTFTLSTGKWYFEIGQSALGASQYSGIGLRPIGQVASGEYTGSISGSYGAIASSTAFTSYSNGASGTAITTAYTASSVFQCAVDFDAGKVWFGDGTSWIGGGSPTSGTSPTYTFTANTNLVPYISAYSTQTSVSFGQRPFTYTPPTGFKALNTQNLPDATIKKGSQYFDTSLFTGTSGNVTISGLGFQPDFVWLKARSNAQGHTLFDSVRGANKYLQSNLTNAEATMPNPPSFTSDGWVSTTDTHTNGFTYAAWEWKKGATQGFDIVTYTGNGAATRSIAHSLGVAPKLIIIKNRTSGTAAWPVYHASIPTQYLTLNTTTAGTAGQWISADSSNFSFSSLSSWTNTNADNYVAYLFSEVAGFSKFGSYTGNGSADGPFVYCGFRPRYLLVKQSDGAQNWLIFDAVRKTYNDGNRTILTAESSAAEVTDAFPIDFTSNGFKVRNTGSGANTSGGTYIFMAFAENPFKNSLAR